MKLFPRRSHSGLERFLDDNFLRDWFIRDPGQLADEHFFAPRVDIHEKKNKTIIEAELPGVEEKDIEVEIDQGVLTISATNESENTEREAGRVIRQERHKGRYQRSFFIGDDIDPDSIEAKFRHGVLKLSVPKPQQEPGRKRKINVR